MILLWWTMFRSRDCDGQPCGTNEATECPYKPRWTPSCTVRRYKGGDTQLAMYEKMLEKQQTR